METITSKELLGQMFESLESVYPEMIKVRRDFHMHPELSFKEVRTPRIIADHLNPSVWKLMKTSARAVSSASSEVRTPDLPWDCVRILMHCR